ncbi:endolytic transglycosylase MltG [Streptomyces sp. NPDC057702]|uniref:endolytic transglycosylase MltG n=1 Tax=unclassified Streptomyces TaxID=2593676 RepID=UPI0036B64C87
MTEYGRSSGSQPWDPEDPLYGDPGWHGQQAAGGQSPYGDQAQHYAQQQDPLARQQYGWDASQGSGVPYGDGGPGDPYAQAQQQGQVGDPYATGQHQAQPHDPYGTGQHLTPPTDPYGTGQQQVPQADPYGTGQHQSSHPDPYGTGQHALSVDPFATGQADQHVDGYPGGQPGHPYGGEQGDYYGTPEGYPAPGPPPPQHHGQPGQPHQPQHPGQPQQPGQHPQPGQHSQPNQHAPQDQYPQDPHAPQGQRSRRRAARGQEPTGHAPQEPVDDWRAEPGAEAYEPETYEAEPAFFADEKDSPAVDEGRGGRRGGGPERDGGQGDREGAYDDAYDDDVSDPREERRQNRERRNKKTKRRSGMACLVVTVVLGGVVGGVGYYGYQFWQSHFGAAPDYAGEGTNEQVQIDIPEGTGVAAMGDILQREGVVKSSRAFVDAANGNPKGDRIQAGTYTLNKEMSGDAAVTMMTDPAALNSLIVTEGMRNSAVYTAIDKKIGAAEGTTKKVAEKEYRNLGLPAWAGKDPELKDPLEGFLFPSRYSVGKDADPAEVLRKMVKQANKKYQSMGLDEAKARDLGLSSPFDIVIIASLVNAEGMTHDDFRKMADVVYNRLKPDNVQTNGLLEFDSTYNYIKNQSKIDLTTQELRKYDNPYNTYHDTGLPPGPIGNPGEDAVKATLKPDRGGWYYFISVDLKTTKFTKTYAEHDKLVDEFNRKRRSGD